MPLLVRGVAESQETGMTLIRALEKVVDNKMVSGPLSKEVKQLVIEMSWGTSFEDALTNFKNRINSPIVNRFCVLVLEASRSGGTIKKVFTATAGFMEEMKDIDRETDAQMKPYIIVIYAAFAVFIVTAILLVRSFFAPMSGSQQISGNTVIGGVGGIKEFFLSGHVCFWVNRRINGWKNRGTQSRWRHEALNLTGGNRVRSILCRYTTKLDVTNDETI